MLSISIFWNCLEAHNHIRRCTLIRCLRQHSSKESVRRLQAQVFYHYRALIYLHDIILRGINCKQQCGCAPASLVSNLETNLYFSLFLILRVYDRCIRYKWMTKYFANVSVLTSCEYKKLFLEWCLFVCRLPYVQCFRTPNGLDRLF